MSDLLNDDEMHALAAEYVLGTLEPDERVRAHAMLDVDHGFRAMVRIWERRFGELHLMVEPVDPPPEIWERIKAQLPPVAALGGETASPSPAAEPESTSAAAPETEEKVSEAGQASAELPPVEPGVQVGGDETTAAAATPTPPTQDSIATELRPAGPAISGTSVPIPLRPLSDPDRGLRAWRALALAMTFIVFALLVLGGAWKFFPHRMPAALQSLFQPSGSSSPSPSRPAATVPFEE
jgi:hypothetical protein